ncbi:MAG: hypothetical protein ACW99F_14450 [Candidatus Hodarchaeales archaeon]|jgi:hypothetical protein
MTCDCNCHYGTKEALCKNCHCGNRASCPTCGQFVEKPIILKIPSKSEVIFAKWWEKELKK